MFLDLGRETTPSVNTVSTYASLFPLPSLLFSSSLPSPPPPPPSPSSSLPPLPSPLLLLYHVSAVDVPQVDNSVNLRGPLFKLSLPGWHGGEGDHQEKGAVQRMLMVETVEEGNCLNRLSKTHLIRKDH